jgi:hypothetical protein
MKEKLFIISIDFDGAFDRVSRSVLIRKLCRFGAGTVFVSCIASMYLKTDNVIFQENDFIMYTLCAGIKQGLPLSPLFFLFYVNDIFSFFQAIHRSTTNCIYEIIHVLLHADDATIIASSRDIAIKKLKTLLQYCRTNHIIPQYSKCEFIVVNGSESDNEPLPLGDRVLGSVGHLDLLGSHLSASGKLAEDLKLHMAVRYKSCIKYYNFLKANTLAPLAVKLTVFKGCVVNGLCYNCETFGNRIPEGLEKMYDKMLRRTLNVRNNIPALTLYIESGFLPIKTVIRARQWNFYERYRSNAVSKSTPRSKLFKCLLEQQTDFLKHYTDISEKYDSVSEVYKEGSETTKEKIREYASKGRYRYQIYNEFNPGLQQSPFITNLHPVSGDIIKFRLGSHNLPIETGRWSKKLRVDRLCTDCHVLGDERHVMYSCRKIERGDLALPVSLSDIWNSEDIFTLFRRLRNVDVFG